MELKRYLVYYNNGLVDTNILVMAKNATQARKLFNKDLNKKSFRKHNNIFDNAHIIKVEEVK